MNKIIKITKHWDPRVNSWLKKSPIDNTILTLSKLFSIKKDPSKDKKRSNKKFPKN